VNEPVSVEIRIETDGRIRLLAFDWDGQRLTVDSQGRDWEKDGEHHFLVMVQGDHIYELAFLQEESLWRLKRQPEDFKGRKFI
jgi:hypothetical protein